MQCRVLTTARLSFLERYLCGTQLATGTGVTPRILLSKTLVDFGTKIVIRSNQIKAPYVADLYITNHGTSCNPFPDVTPVPPAPA